MIDFETAKFIKEVGRQLGGARALLEAWLAQAPADTNPRLIEQTTKWLEEQEEQQ